MTKSGKTEIICVIDRSASMGTIRKEAISAFNLFLEEQKKVPGECLLTYTQFNTVYDIVHNGIPLHRMQPLTDSDYIPAGMTALLDAIGRTVDAVGERFSRMPEHERPETVILVILTDGEENASREYSYERIKQMLEHQTKVYNWRIIFLAQNLDTAAVARNIGINPDSANVMAFNMLGGGSGYQKGMKGVSHYVTSARAASASGAAFSADSVKEESRAIIQDDDDSSSSQPEPPKPNRATGKGIARAQAERDKSSRRRRRTGEPDLD